MTISLNMQKALHKLGYTNGAPYFTLISANFMRVFRCLRKKTKFSRQKTANYVRALDQAPQRQ